MRSELSPLYQKICAYSPDDPSSALTFTTRLAQENGWDLGYAQRVVAEYKKFMFLAVTAGHTVTPSDQVDQTWHLHLIYTRSYWDEFCDEVLGERVHHGPTQGGPRELKKYRGWYEQTKASYRQQFNEEPPSDIWPETEVRFGPQSRHVWVNPQSAWIVPKPWAHLNALHSSAALVTGSLVIELGVTNPLDLGGQEFLTFYTIIGLVGLGGAIVARILLRLDTSSDVEPELSAYEVACLARGTPGVLQSSLAGLVADGRLQVRESQPKKLGPISLGKPRYLVQAAQPPTGGNAVERTLIEQALDDQGVEPGQLLSAAQPAAEAIESELRGKGLLESDESFRAARWWPTLILVSVWWLGAAKLIVGLARDQPVGFLLVGMVLLTIVIVAFWRRPFRSPAGDRLLKNLRREHETLHDPGNIDRANARLSDVVIAAGLFGLTSIHDPEIEKLDLAMKSLASSQGGAGYGAGCGGGGCGGGGCGGCGG